MSKIIAASILLFALLSMAGQAYAPEHKGPHAMAVVIFWDPDVGNQYGEVR